MEKWKIPGLTVAIIKDGKVVCDKAFGLKSVKSNSEVTTKTPFMIGSLTKSMTCTAVLLAEERGVLSVNDPIQKYLKIFRTNNPNHSSIIDIEEFLTGRNGLNAHQGDFLFWKTNLNRSKALNVLPTFESYPIRKKITYNNLSYVVLGEVIKAATKKNWEENMHEYFFKPLNMKYGFASSKWLKEGIETAKPHLVEDNKVIPLNDENIDNMGPAGSVFSSSTDTNGLIIYYNKYDTIYILPKSNDGLITELLEMNPGVTFV
jgi:CubicO group peptidase (beta-lactamase class C family)